MKEKWKNDLSALFSPRSIAVIGASERSHYCVLCLENLALLGFPPDRLYLVNPTRSEAFGQKTYPDLASVDGEVDLAIMLVNRDRTLSAFQDCIAKGVRAVVLLASGFAEQDQKGAEIQAEIAALGDRHHILVCGPNCTGIANVSEGFAAYDGAGVLPTVGGGVSVVFQSGGLMNPLMETAAGRGVGIRNMVSVGNAAVLAVEDYLFHFVQDEQTKLIASYVESMRDPARGLAAITAAAAVRKPILMIKAGRSARGRRAAASHTASLVASGRAWDGVLRQKGVVLVDSIDELVESSVLMSIAGKHDFSGRLGFVTISGGDTSLFCDLCDKYGLTLSELADQTLAALVELTGKTALLGNPLDLGGGIRFGTPEFLTCFDTFIRDPGLDVIAVRLNLPKAPTDSVMHSLLELKTRCEGVGKLLVVFSRATERWDADWYPRMANAGIPFLSEFGRGCLALRRWADYCAFQREHEDSRVVDEPSQASAPLDIETRSGVWLYEEAAALLGRHGVPTAPARSVRTLAELKTRARDLRFPMVLKVDSRQIAHRNAVGGVAVGLTSEGDLERAFTEITKRVSDARPDAEISGLVLQEQVPAALEMIVGIARSDDLGPVVLVGSGGVAVEHDADVAIGYPPLSRVEAGRLLRSLRTWPRISAVIGESAQGFGDLLEIICRVSELAAGLAGTPLEIDLNPVMVSVEGATAVDVLVSTDSALSESSRLL